MFFFIAIYDYCANSLFFITIYIAVAALCVLAVFVLVYFSLWKGVKSTGKVGTNLLILCTYSTVLGVGVLISQTLGV